MGIVLPGRLPVGPGRDDGDRATLPDYLDEALGVLVGKQRAWVMSWACRELELDGLPRASTLAAEATAASAQALCPLAPLLRGAPAAQGRIMVRPGRCSMSGVDKGLMLQTPRSSVYNIGHTP